jgi:hypothetical protein
MAKNILEVPFFENDRDGDQCMQVAMQSVLKYYLGTEYSLDTLDSISGREKSQWTWTPQIVDSLYGLGLDVTYYSTMDAQRFVDDRSYFFEHYGEEAEEFAAVVDLDVVIGSIRRVLENDLFKQQQIEADDIEAAIDTDAVPLILIDWNDLTDSGSAYQGHLVTITGYDPDHFYYHESGPAQPEPHKQVHKTKLMEAWDKPQTDHDLVVVDGTRTLHPDLSEGEYEPPEQV